MTGLLPGWRCRLGVISPTVIERIAWDFLRCAPEGLMPCGVTCFMDGWEAGQYETALARLDQATAYLAKRRVDAILHVAAPIVVGQGPGFDRTLLARMEQAAAAAAGRPVPCFTTIRCALDAFAALGAGRILALTPFHERLNAQLVTFVEAEGVAVAALAPMPTEFDHLQDASPDRMFRAVLAAAETTPTFDAVWIPSGQLPAVELVRPLEARLGRPVVAQNHADLFAPCRALGVGGFARGQGRLLDLLAG